MLEKSKNFFYRSLSKSIRTRKKDLGLKRDDILFEPTRVSKIVNNTRNKHHPHLIGGGEYAYLNYLFLCESHEAFINENILNTPLGMHEKKNGKNYDKMLWGHINWDKMFRYVIVELLKLDSSEELEKMFEDTLIDYVPYAAIKYEELNPEYGKVYIFPNERKKIRYDAIKWVHLRHGSGLFKQTFYKRFSGKTLREFDKEFFEFISDYLEKRKPDGYSLGLQAYNYHKTVSSIAAYWQSLDEIQYSDASDEKSDFQTLLEEYMENGREQMRKLGEYQQKFDNLHIDIK